jgi:outer membrane protein insertion porin family
VKKALRIYPFILLTIIISACSGTRHLEDGEKWLYKQKVRGINEVSKNPAIRLINLRPNTRLPLLGPLGANIYETGRNKWDSLAIVNEMNQLSIAYDSLIASRAAEGKNTEKLANKRDRKLARLEKKRTLGNFRMRTGTPLSRYDSLAIENSRLRIKNYMNEKGFLSAEVAIEGYEKNDKVYQDFVVTEGPRSFIDSTLIRTGDPAIAFLIQASLEESFLKKGASYDKDNIDRERARLEALLRNNGYYELDDRFINFEVYYAPNQTDLWVTTVIKKPANRPIHKPFTLDSVIINTQGNEMITERLDFDTVAYNIGAERYNPRVIDARLKITPGEKYSFENIRNTQRQLLNMNVFRYVNINFDTTQIPGKFITNIYTAPQRKYQLTQEVGLNMTEGVPGPFYNLSIVNRNIFGGAENLQLTGFIGSEGVSGISSETGVLSSFQYGGNLALTFPRFNIPFTKNKFSKRVFNPTNTVSVGYAFTDRPEYVRSNLNGRFGYAWQNATGQRSFTLNLIDINFINTNDVDPAFQKLLDDLLSQGNTLALAFNRSFVSSTSFSALYNFNYSNDLNPSSFFRYLLETGGPLNNFAARAILDDNEDPTEGSPTTGLEYYQYAKVQFDYRRHYPLPDNKALAFRIHTGVAYAYGENEALPYEKYFFTGGSNSNRAWSPRRLGPGSSFPYLLDANGNNVLDENGDFVPNRTGADSYLFEQPGEILLEMSAEYRAKLSGFLDYAIFVDAGNLWQMRAADPPSDPTQVVRASPGANFEFNRFYKEIAVGAGLGLRFDFTFLVFRFDYGIKLRDPRFPEGQRWRKPFETSTSGVWNIAVGYPF